MRVRLQDIRGALEGIIPATIATCDDAGTPNVTYISHVHRVDDEHVALTYQFFNKTRRNLLANPNAAIARIDPRTGAPYRLKIEYLRTETDGPVFEDLRARLDAVEATLAEQTGRLNLDEADIAVLQAVQGSLQGTVAGNSTSLAATRADLDDLADVVADQDDAPAALSDSLDVVEDRLGILEDVTEPITRVDDGDTLLISDVNVQIVSGAGATDASTNGRGNLIVGYNEERTGGNDRSGSHNLVVGDRHSYRGFGGIVAGQANDLLGDYSSILSGSENTVTADHATILGGRSNTVTEGTVAGEDGDGATLSGGYEGTATGRYSSVSGGRQRVVHGLQDWAGGSYFADD